MPFRLKSDESSNTREQRLRDWNGPAYQRIRQPFLDGRYGEPVEEICPYLLGEDVAAPPDEEVLAAVNARQTVLDYGIKTLQHDVDRGCNLSCTMCRDEKILPDAGNVARALRDVDDALEMGSLDALAWSGAGEVIAMAPEEAKRYLDLVAPVAASVLSANPKVKDDYEALLAAAKKYRQ